MSAIVQQNSGVATDTSIKVEFNNPVAKGSLLIAAFFTASFNPISVTDGTEPSGSGGNQYRIAAEFVPVFGQVFNIYFATAAEAEPLGITVQLPASDTIHLHIFEVSGGYDSTEQSGSNYQNTSTTNGTVSTQEATTHADSFVLAMFADTFGSVVFSEGREVSSAGVQTATASQNFASTIASAIATFYASSGPTPPPPSDSSVFLGSVRVLGSAPAGARVPYLGTVKVVASPPTGATNPYLGSMVIGTPGPNNSNPSLGEVVVVDSVPAGDSDPFLGSVAEG